MAETPEATEEAAKAPELTKPADFLVPNQDKIEQVIDARLAAHAANEKAESKTTSRSRTKAAEKPADES